MIMMIIIFIENEEFPPPPNLFSSCGLGSNVKYKLFILDIVSIGECFQAYAIISNTES